MLVRLPPRAPVRIIRGGIGVGASSAWCDAIAAEIKAHGTPAVLAIPLLELGEQYVEELRRRGITARVYRGRDADHPTIPGRKMCRELHRVQRIQSAIGDVYRGACERHRIQCRFFDSCDYLAQGHEEPDVWVVAEQRLFRKRPEFIPHPKSLTLDKPILGAALHGAERLYSVSIGDITRWREVPKLKSERRDELDLIDHEATTELARISVTIGRVIAECSSALLSINAIRRSGLTGTDFGAAYSYELRRLHDVPAIPNMPRQELEEIVEKVEGENQVTRRLSQLWTILARAFFDCDADAVPWIEIRGVKHSEIVMTWAEEIDQSWLSPTLVFDGFTPLRLIKQFFPRDSYEIKPVEELSVTAAHTYIRQITDSAMPQMMFTPIDGAKRLRDQTWRKNNIDRLRRFVEVRSWEVSPGRVLVVCQRDVQTELEFDWSRTPSNADFRHFNDLRGLNNWAGVTLVIVVGRTEPNAREVERRARAFLETDIAPLPQAERGTPTWPKIDRAIRLRNGDTVTVSNSCHPDPLVEMFRHSICETELMEAIGRGRSVIRTEGNPLEVDILTNVALPLEVDEVTTWDNIRPRFLTVMIARGAVPTNFNDMRRAYPDLFSSADAARGAMQREAREQTRNSLNAYLMEECAEFSHVQYRHSGSRGPANVLYFDPARIQPQAWLSKLVFAAKIVG